MSLLYLLGSDGWVRMWDLTKILSAKPTVEEAASERPIFHLDPMNEVSMIKSSRDCQAS